MIEGMLRFLEFHSRWTLVDRKALWLIPKDLRRKRALDDAIINGERVQTLLSHVPQFRDVERVLDVGCGDGTVAAAFARRGFDGSYRGFDIRRSWIDALGQLYKGSALDFRFDWADIYHDYYNPKGRIKAEDFRFPVADNDVDLVIFNSIFTHMKLGVIRHNLAEARRCLSPRGKVWCTFFQLDDEPISDGAEAHFQLNATYDEGWTGIPEKPESVVIFPKEKVLAAIRKSGLSVIKYLPGTWKTGGETPLGNLQDIYVLERSHVTA